MTVSVVIPTRNRPESLLRLFRALEGQTDPAKEIIIVDASDDDNTSNLRAQFPHLPLKLIRSSPSVCKQRNIGIAASESDFIFLCDDDMEPEAGYIGTIVAILASEPSIPIATGWIREKGPDGELRDLPLLSFRRLVWNFLFGLGVWTDLDTVTTTTWTGPFLTFLKERYRRKGNRTTRGGWPLVTQVKGTVFRTATFGLGACIGRRAVLASHPFDELLDERGIGDNYVYARGLGPDLPICVVTGTGVRHHRSSGTGSSDPERYARRILVLDYALTDEAGGKAGHRPFLVWSLIGNLIAFAAHRNRPLVHTTLYLLRLLATGQNPYLGDMARNGSAPSTNMVLPPNLAGQ